MFASSWIGHGIIGASIETGLVIPVARVFRSQFATTNRCMPHHVPITNPMSAASKIDPLRIDPKLPPPRLRSRPISMGPKMGRMNEMRIHNTAAPIEAPKPTRRALA
jgi:hypothetical protein